MKVNDMTRAMVLPEYRSRMMDLATVTLAAAKPWTKRHPRRAAKLPVNPHRRAATT
jgi:hypothetical protein